MGFQFSHQFSKLNFLSWGHGCSSQTCSAPPTPQVPYQRIADISGDISVSSFTLKFLELLLTQVFFFFRSLWSSQAFDPLAGQWRSQSCGSPSPNPIQWSSQWHAMRIDWAGDTLQYVKALAEGSTWHIYITCKKTRPPKKIKKQMGLPQFPSKLRKWWWYPDFGLWYRQTRIYIYQKTNSPFPYVNISIHIYL